MNKHVDPVIVEVIRNLLLSIADETNTVIIKSAYSTNIKERRDNTVAIMDAKGDVVAQVEGSIPILLATSLFIAKRILEKYGEEGIHPGDMFILNDPYSGSGNHLPDITICAPVFAGEKLIAWVSNIAHHSDIGGSVPGSIVGNATSIFEEGIRIPIVHICRDGKINDDVMDMLIGNTRTREERLGDFTAQISANLIGIEKMQSAYQKYGDVLLDCMEEIQNYAGRMMCSTISKIPDGVYSFEDYVDGCGDLVPHPINIRVKITVAGDQMTMDFTGTHAQVEAPINIPFPALMSAILFSIKALVGPGLPTNSGIFRPITVIAPEGCLVNPVEPAPVCVLIDAAQRIPDTIFGALAQAMPERILASSNGACTTCMLFGRTQHSGGKYFICHESIAGGSGASHFYDGLSGVQVYLTNTSNMPIEATEMEYPDIRLEQYFLRKDSGGAGKFRGGCGIQREYKICSDGMAVNCLGDRQKFQPWGLDGGLPGAGGAFYLVDGVTGKKTKLSHKTSNLAVKKGDSILVLTPGAGGVGDPKQRDPKQVLRDVQENLVSPEMAEKLYGVEVEMSQTGVYQLKEACSKE